MSRYTSSMATSKDSRFCPICGRPETRELPFINGLCRDCFLKQYGVARVPERIDLTICNYCGAYKLSRQWFEQKPRTFLEAVVNALYHALLRTIEPVEGVQEVYVERIEALDPVETYGEYRFKVTLKGTTDRGVEIGKDYIVTVRVSAAICPSCIKRKTGYHEALVQIRGLGGTLEDEEREKIRRFLTTLPPRLQEQVVDVEERREGIDLMVTDHSSARIIASKLAHIFVGRKIETYSLIGRRADGKRLGKLTISVRVPGLRKGELVAVDGSPFLVEGVERGRLHLLDLERNVRRTFDAEGFWSRNVERDPYVERLRLLLVSKGRDAYIFLDADTSYSKVVEYPVRYVVNLTGRDLVEGEEYQAYKVGSRIYIII